MTLKQKHLIAAICALISLSAQAAVRKPNFIFIIADDHRWDAMGVFTLFALDDAHGSKPLISIV